MTDECDNTTPPDQARLPRSSPVQPLPAEGRDGSFEQEELIGTPPQNADVLDSHMSNDPFFLEIELEGLQQRDLMVNAPRTDGTAYGGASAGDTASAVSINTSTNGLHDISHLNVNGWSPSELVWMNNNDASWKAISANAAVHDPLCVPAIHHMEPDKMDFLSLNDMALETGLSAADMFHAGLSSSDQVMVTQHNNKAVAPFTQVRVLNAEAGGSPSSPIEAAAIPIDITASKRPGIFTRMPSLLKEPPRETLTPIVDGETYEIILADVKSRLLPKLELDVSISMQEMQRFLDSYFLCYNRHCPIINLPSLNLKATPSHLILAICAIGALYRLSRQKAHDLWRCANEMVEKELVNHPPAHLTSRSAIAALQSKLLLDMFAVFSGNMTEQAISASSYWATEYRIRRVLLTSQPFDFINATWESWILRETLKRLLFGVFIMNSLMTIAYDLTPTFSITQDLDIEILDEECFWEASTSQEWESLKRKRRLRSNITVRDAFAHLVLGKEQPSSAPRHPIKWTAFATTVIMHAVNIYMWNAMQSTQSFTAFAVDEQTSMNLKSALISQTETALARCYALLTADRPEREHTSDDAEGPLLFNCLALLRCACICAYTGADNFNRLTLLSENPVHVAASVEAYVSGGAQDRGPHLTSAVDKAYGGLLTPIRAGYLLVRKTAALTWSLEHAIAAWDCALFATKWIHTLETQQQESPPDQEESKVLLSFRQLLDEVDSQYDGTGSLAGEITRVWASFLDDTWVWGLTPRMGRVLRQLSEAFNQDWRRKFPHGNPTGVISR